MKTLKITILAEDIKSTDYFSSSDCAITRALHRAGRPDLKHCGSMHIGLTNPDGDTDYIGQIDQETYNTVIGMYHHSNKDIKEYLGEHHLAKIGRIEPRDFEATITLTEEES